MTWYKDRPTADGQSGGSGEDPGVVAHVATTGRSDPNQHPIGAIAGLQAGLNNAVIQTDVTVTGAPVGGLATGQVVPAGSAVAEVLKSILTTRVPPVYTQPTLSLVSTGVKTVESGTVINETHTPTWVKNDAGAAVSYALKCAGTTVFSQATPAAYQHNYGALVDAQIAYTAEVQYAEGAVKLDNLGDAYATGHIAAGTKVSSAVTFSAVRRVFFGVSDQWGTSAVLRALANSYLGAAQGLTRSVTGQTGNKFVIAYPAALRNITAFTMVSGGFTFNILDQLTYQTQVQVAGADGASNAMAYKVAVFQPVGAFADVTFSFTI